MALINCPECGKEISEKAGSCPNCGCPLNTIEKAVEESKKTDGVHYARPTGSLPKREEKKRKKKTWIWIVVGVIVLFVLVGSSGGNSEDVKEVAVEGKTNEGVVAEEKSNEAVTVEETTMEAIEYNAYTVDEMVSVLNENALKAEKTFQDQYVEITGRLSVIDSDGRYISLYPINDEWAIIGVQCYIQNEEQLNQVLEMKMNDTIVLRGKIKSIGEIMGYSLHIDSID